LFFSLESIHGWTQKITYQARDAKKKGTLCYECKNAISLEEANAWYATIQCWWYYSGSTNEVGLQELEN
jgi:hypothetical protein